MPTSLICALESTSLEDAVRDAVSLGGDAYTLAATADAIGKALHGLDEGLVRTARKGFLQNPEDITATLDVLDVSLRCGQVPRTCAPLVHTFRRTALGPQSLPPA